jgi:hypothetical protein
LEFGVFPEPVADPPARVERLTDDHCRKGRDFG